MKEKRMQKKLSFTKVTVASLNNDSMNHFFGGILYTQQTCLSFCKLRTACMEYGTCYTYPTLRAADTKCNVDTAPLMCN